MQLVMIPSFSSNTHGEGFFHFSAFISIIVNCENGEMRLMEGKDEWEGRLEVCYNRRWGTVSGDEWTLTNSHVVCNALGYNTTSKPFLQLQNATLQSYLLWCILKMPHIRSLCNYVL